MNAMLRSTISMTGDRKPYLKLKMGRKVKRMPCIPDSYMQLSSFVKSTIPPFNEGKDFNLTYFDDELEAISIADQSDYEAFLSFVEDENVRIPKIILTEVSEEMPTFESATAEMNRTMCVSYIGDSEMERPRSMVQTPRGPGDSVYSQAQEANLHMAAKLQEMQDMVA